MNTPEEKVFTEFDRLITQFLWKGKKAKIKLRMLQGSIAKGGRKLINLKQKNAALKLAWLFKSDPTAEAQLNVIVPKELKEIFWQCSLSAQDATRFVEGKTENKFWIEIISMWFDVKSKIEDTIPPHEQVIWLNSQIKIANQVILPNRLAAQGLMYVKDLIGVDGKLYSVEEMSIKWETSIDWLWYKSLCNAIPKGWRIATATKNTVYIPLYTKIQSKPKPSAYVYEELINNEDKEFKYYYALFSKNVKCTEQQYEEAHVNINKISNIVKYRDFQYRLLVNAIHANDKLCHWKIVTENTCELCMQEKQTITHLMYQCKEVRKLWKSILIFLQKCTKIDTTEIELTSETIMLNNVHPKATHVANTIILIVKQYIYYCKCAKKRINLHDAICKIESIYQSEYYNSKTDPQVARRCETWKLYESKRVKQ